MTKSFPIDFIRQAIEQTLYEEHLKNPSKFLGGENQVSLFSFYEQLVKDEEVNRYVEKYRDLVEQQNRSGIIANGVIVAPENPTITNLFSALIIPMTFTCSFRCLLKDRDIVLDTINNMIETLKGTKVDIAEFESGKLFKVGTIGNNGLETPSIENGDFLNVNSISGIATKITQLVAYGFVNNVSAENSYVYYDDSTYGLSVALKTSTGWTRFVDDNEHPNIIFPTDSGSFTKYKLSLSFDSLRCEEPRTLNGNENVLISFGGSATLVSDGVKLGNDLIKVGFKKTLIKGNPDITIADTLHYLEPLEIPSGNSADTQMNNLISNKFITNTHTDSLSISLQYTFICDTNIDLIKQWFRYARYGLQANGTTITYLNGITPNMIYEVRELWSSWGNVEIDTFKAKIVESIDVENTESDTLTITIPFQIQGDNN